ncbi:transcriptional regulator [Kitasatospora phosalacinea]|uniref:Transcriptional regulator n=1 Tax=Kitasatospora phosalacinea TaxID=2065 RepID=A0A9W6QFF5_9ACTN|nr:AraC family transcriptional regulator [Kitasatospora phosalacinea]GLW73993.1 transcriptional regulator [Kitasatospora phosalacinea]
MSAEHATFSVHRALPQVELLDAHYVDHAFGRHTHDTYVVAAITAGVEEFHYGGGIERAGAGTVALVNPEVVVTGHAGVPEGWGYRVLYPAVESVLDVAADLRPVGAGTPAFTTAVAHDDELARLVHAVHGAVGRDDALAASTAFRLLVARLLRTHAAPRTAQRVGSAGALAVVRARELLRARLVDPPGLEELAAAVGARPFPLLRAFRDAHGLPPHAWLNQQRVAAARSLLRRGVPPAEVAVAVGFVDQAHLSRHFRRSVGVPPGAYRRAVQERTRPPRPAPGTVGA